MFIFLSTGWHIRYSSVRMINKKEISCVDQSTPFLLMIVWLSNNLHTYLIPFTCRFEIVKLFIPITNTEVQMNFIPDSSMAPWGITKLGKAVLHQKKETNSLKVVV